MPLYIEQSGHLDRCYRCLTDSLTTLKDRATQLLIKSGALVTQFHSNLPWPGWCPYHRDRRAQNAMCQKINRVRREVGRGEFPGQSSNLASLGNSKCDQKVKIFL